MQINNNYNPQQCYVTHVSAVLRLKCWFLFVSQNVNAYLKRWRKLIWPWKRKPFVSDHNYSFSAMYSFCFQFHLIIHSLLALSFKSIFWLTTLIFNYIAIFLLLFHNKLFSVGFTRTACNHVASIKPSHTWKQHTHARTRHSFTHTPFNSQLVMQKAFAVINTNLKANKWTSAAWSNQYFH